MPLETQIAEQFRALPHDPTFQITHDPTDPRALVRVPDDVLEEFKTGAQRARDYPPPGG